MLTGEWEMLTGEWEITQKVATIMGPRGPKTPHKAPQETISWSLALVPGPSLWSLGHVHGPWRLVPGYCEAIVSKYFSLYMVNGW